MKPHKDSKCGVCATDPFQRNNYFFGKQFTVRDLQQEQSYFNDKRHLINRMVLGWGVVCGSMFTGIGKSASWWLDQAWLWTCCGHEIVVCENQYLSFDKNDDDCCLDDKQRPQGKFVLCLEYHECNSEPIDFPAAGCDEKVRLSTTALSSDTSCGLVSWDDACPKEPHDPYCPDQYKHDANDEQFQRECTTEDLHHYLCELLNAAVRSVRTATA
jgi:hypothetical protein